MATCQESQFFSPFCMRAAAVTGSAATGFPAQNLTQGRMPWRATGVTASLTVQFPDAVAATHLILCATNFSFDATVRLYAGATEVATFDVSRQGPASDDCFDDPGGAIVDTLLINDVAQRGDAATTVFSVGGAAGLHVKELQVFIDGLRQIPTTDYTVADDGFDLSCTFTTAPRDGAKLHFYACTELQAGAGVTVSNTQTGNGATTAFTVTGAANTLAEEIEVFLDGIRQTPTADYTVGNSGADLIVTFIVAPSDATTIYFYSDFDTGQSPGDGVRVDEEQTGDAIAVSFTLTGSAGVATNALEVFVDGLRQQAGADYRATSVGLDLVVTFFTPPSDGALVYFYADSDISAATGFGLTSEDWPRRNIFAEFPEATSDVWTLTISDPANRDGQLRALRLMITSPSVAEHIQDGWTIDQQHVIGTPTRTLSGGVIPPQSDVYRVMTIKTSLMTSDNAYAAMRRDLALGLNQELFIVPCPDDPAMIESTSFLGMPVQIPQIQSRGTFSRWSRPLVLQEIF